MDDVGIQILNAIYDQLKVEDQWSVRRQRGFLVGGISTRTAHRRFPASPRPRTGFVRPVHPDRSGP